MSAEPCQRSSRNAIHTSFQTPWHYRRKPCVLRPPAESAERLAGLQCRTPRKESALNEATRRH